MTSEAFVADDPIVLTKEDITTFLKGFAMGAANVVPGVSGGTIALITGIYERLIEALKSFDSQALKMGARFQVADLWRKIDGRFLTALFFGAIVALATLARALQWGFENKRVMVLALFFGLIAASIPSVGKLVKKWNLKVILVFMGGLAIALSMAFLEPANESANIFYLGMCGVAALCSMIIPGLSGSFVLLLLGNYELIMLDAVSSLTSGNLSSSLPILIPVGIGAVMGVLALSRFLSWLFQVHHDLAVGAITGFVAGSLAIIWPWKEPVTEAFMKADGEIKIKIVGYQNWRLPDFSSASFLSELLLLVLGVVLILGIESLGRRNSGK